MVAGYGKMTILHGTTFEVSANAITDCDRPQRRRQVDCPFKTIFEHAALRLGSIHF